MIIPAVTLFLLFSIIWLVIGIKGRKETALLILNLFWWSGAFVSAYFTWLVWQERGYSENWAMVGFIFWSLPYIFTTGIMVAAELFAIRKWQSNKTTMIKVTSASLLIFLMFQLLVGFLSA